MATPPRYARTKDFSEDTGATTDNADINTELDKVQQSIDAVIDNLVKIQRDDGKLMNRVVDWDQLHEGVVLGLAKAELWGSGVTYTTNQTVIYGDAWYRAVDNHTSGGTFAGDAAHWDLLIDFAAWATSASNSAAAAATSEANALTYKNEANASAASASADAAAASQAVGAAVRSETASAGQTAFTAPTYTPGTEMLLVFVNGALSRAYTETSTTTITFTSAMAGGEKVVILRSKRLTTAATATTNIDHEGEILSTVLNRNKVVDNIVALRSEPLVTGITYLVRNHSTDGDNGGGFFFAVDGAAAATYYDDNGATILPSGGDGSSAFLRQMNGFALTSFWGASSARTAGENTTAMQAAIDYCQGSRGVVLFVNDYLNFNNTLTITGNLSIKGQHSSGGNSNTDKSALNWDGATAGLDAAIRIIGQNWSIESVAIKGALKVQKVLRLEAASVGRIKDCTISGAKKDVYATPGTCVWGCGLINVIIDGCYISHDGYARGIHVEEANKPGGSIIYYGFDNGSAIKNCRIYGNMANIIADGGTFAIEHNDFEGQLIGDTAKVICPGSSAKLRLRNNYGEFDNTSNSDPNKQPMIFFQIQGASAHDLTITDNVVYTVPQEEAGSIAFDCGSGSPSAYYAKLVLTGNSANRFESFMSLRGRDGGGFATIHTNTYSFCKQIYASKSYYKGAANVTVGSRKIGIFSATRPSANVFKIAPEFTKAGFTERHQWVDQSNATIDFTCGNNIYYSGVSGAGLTYGGKVTSLTVTGGGTGYTSAPNVSISANGVLGFSATATAEIASGAVTALNLTAQGENYAAAPTVSFSGGGGSGATATAGIDRSIPVEMCGATWRLQNRSGGNITLNTGNGTAGTFKAGAGITSPITLTDKQIAVITAGPDRVMTVEAVVG